MNRRILVSFLFLLFFLAGFTGRAQQSLRYSAMLPVIDSSGFYKIVLQPGLVAKCRTGLPDLRLFDEKNQVVRYIQADRLPPKASAFVEFPQVPGSYLEDSIDVAIVSNRSALPVTALWMKLKNTSVTRTVNILGSDDLRTWYAIQEEIPLRQAANTASDHFEQQLALPPSAYRYFKVQVNGRKKSPLRVLSIGVYAGKEQRPVYTRLPVPAFTSTDSAGRSLVRLHFDQRYEVSLLDLVLREPGFFKRRVIVYAITDGKRVQAGDKYISSADGSRITLSVQADSLEVEVMNGDNPPLEIKSVNAFQQEKPVVAFLEKGRKYRFLFGDQKIAAPEYDLAYFTDRMAADYSTITHLPVTANRDYRETGPAAQKDYTLAIWIALGAVLCLLLVFTLKLTREVKQRKD